MTAGRGSAGARVAYWGLWALLGGCAGTETGNPSFAGKLGYDAYTSAPAVVALGAALRASDAPSSLVVDHAWLVLGDVELLSGSACDRELGPHVHGVGAGDHVSGQAAPTPFESPAGDYCGLRLPLEPGGDRLPLGAPDSLHSESVLLRGELPDGRPYQIHSRLQINLMLHASSGEFLLDAQHADVVVGFDVARWLGALRWDAASAQGDGTVLVDADHNPGLLEAFEAALPVGVGLFRDQDGDGELDSQPLQLATGEP